MVCPNGHGRWVKPFWIKQRSSKHGGEWSLFDSRRFSRSVSDKEEDFLVSNFLQHILYHLTCSGKCIWCLMNAIGTVRCPIHIYSSGDGHIKAVRKSLTHVWGVAHDFQMPSVIHPDSNDPTNDIWFQLRCGCTCVCACLFKKIVNTHPRCRHAWLLE